MLKRGGKNTIQELYKKSFNDLNNQWCGHLPRTGHPGVCSQGDLMKHYHEQS